MDVVDRFIRACEVDWHHGELQRSAALQEQDVVVLADIQQGT